MLIEVLLVLFVVFLLFYRYVTKQFGKWEALGIPCVKGTFPAGSNPETLLGTKNLNDIALENYLKFKDHDYFGTYVFGKPVLNINNVDLVRDIMVKNFNNFVDRNDPNIGHVMDGGKIDQAWKNQMSNLSGDAWKDVRSAFSPIFTSGKMRGMLKYIEKVGSSLKNEFGICADAGEDFELKEVFGKFSLDSLASCAFGINADSFNDKTNRFTKSADRIFTNTTWDLIQGVSRLLPGVQRLHKWLNISIIKPKETAFFQDVILQTIKHRRETGERKNDLIDLMIDCMSPDATENETEDATDQYERDMKLVHDNRKRKIDDSAIVSTAFVFLVAGYDTTGMTLSCMAYYLAKNPDVQSKLQEEIDEAFENNNGKLPDYQIILNLPYLEMCIMETLRIQPPVGTIFRVCTKDCKVGEVQMRKGDLLNIMAIGIHQDERYYPHPDQFNPENFSKEARQSRSPYTFLAFGQGPRACIGMRFAMLEAKLAMMEVLHAYTFLPSNKNPEKLVLDPQSQLGNIKGGIWARIERRSKA